MQTLTFVVYGEPASKANQRRLVMLGSKPAFIKSQKALDYAQSFKQQCEPHLSHMTAFDCDVKVEMTIYYASRRPDLDESLILDLLQGVTYINDRQVKEKHIRWGLDKENPRCEIRVSRIE
jgi:Holliday junction resolvase RusA-like endonuclease